MMTKLVGVAPDRSRAEAAANLIASILPGASYMKLNLESSDYGVTPLEFAPNPTAHAKSWFTDEMIEPHLDRLERDQEPDGGRPISWQPPSRERPAGKEASSACRDLRLCVGAAVGISVRGLVVLRVGQAARRRAGRLPTGDTMSAFVHTMTLKAKSGRLGDARAEVARLAEVAEANGATSARLLASMAGDTSEGVLVLEFESGEAWATFMQSDIVREARRTRYEEDYPIIVTNTSVFQELAINPD